MIMHTLKYYKGYYFFVFVFLWQLYEIQCTGYAAEQSIYDEIFVNYSSFLRPVQQGNANSQTMVNISVGFMQIESLNERQQKFTSHGYFSLSWVDELLHWDPNDHDGQWAIHIQADKVWLPEITPVNNVQGAVELASVGEDMRVRVLYTGVVYWVPAMKWETSCFVDVAKFPYDTQTCHIEYANWMYTATYVNFTSVFPEADISSITENLEWEVTSTAVTTYEMNTLPVLRITINLKRDPTFFELNVLLPAMLLSFLMIPVFILPVESGEKTSLGVTLMLAYSIFLLMMTDVTPKAGTTPKLTILILVSTVFSGLSIILSVIVINVHHHRPEKPLPTWMKYLFLVKLSKWLCCMNYADENEVESIKPDDPNFDNSVVTEKAQHKLQLGSDFSVNAVSGLIHYQNFMKTRVVRKDQIADNHDDWVNFARVLDRIFMWIYVFYFISNMCAVLSIKYS